MAQTDQQNSGRPLRIVAVMGSYRDGGAIEQLTEAVLSGAREQGAQAEMIRLKDHPIEFCTNCRQCMQQPGPERGRCVHEDGMEAMLQQLEAADAVVLAAPVNLWNVNALTRRFMERCAGFAYWPWGQPAPKMRQPNPTKKAVLISSSGAPAFAAQWLSGAQSALKFFARVLGAKPIGVLWEGKVSERTPQVAAKSLDKAQRLGRELAT